MKLEETDRITLEEKGISEEKLAEELRMLREGFPYLRIEAPATPGHGIDVLDETARDKAVALWEKYLAGGARVVKMVPASGAASRMFKNVFSFANGKSDKPDSDFMKEFFDNIEKFAFFDRLNSVCLSLYGKSIPSLIEEKRYKDIARALLDKAGLGYGQLPKALLQFHKVMGGSRTALEEHLAEGASYAAGKDGKVSVHFTVSEEHIPLVESKLEESAKTLEHRYGVVYDISMSVQKPATDTVAANPDGTPYRENGRLFFRPGGHGALIENLNDIDADVIFIKNIDNVVPDMYRGDTIEYKKVLGGLLVAVREKIDRYCHTLSKGVPEEKVLDEIAAFLRDVLNITHLPVEGMDAKDKADFFFAKLHRPLRICGMVKNEGEPGGGPFLVYNADGTVSPQILESTQINSDDKEACRMLKESTHFNPVDLVCSTKDYKGEKFNLPDYVDKTTGFISRKSREGVEILALELPGLWNGAMSDWNTILVEVPASTFNPVKTVNDLLRPMHQAH